METEFPDQHSCRVLGSLTEGSFLRMQTANFSLCAYMAFTWCICMEMTEIKIEIEDREREIEGGSMSSDVSSYK